MGSIPAIHFAWRHRVHLWMRGVFAFLALLIFLKAGICSHASQVAVSGNYIFSVDSQSRFSISETDATTNLTLLGIIPDLFGVTSLAVQGHYAYVVTTNDRLVVYDVSSPTNITYVRDKETRGTPVDITVAGSFAFIPMEAKGIQTFDLINPSNPIAFPEFYAGSVAYSARFTNNFLFVAGGADGLDIFNLSGDSTVFATNKPTATLARIVRVAGNFAYVSCDGGRLEIFNIANPSAPTLAGTFLSSTPISDLDIAGNFAVLAKTNGSVLTLNVSNPASPSLQNSNYVAGGAVALRVVGNRAFVRTVAGNLIVLPLSGPSQVAPAVVHGLSALTELVGDSTSLSVTTVGSSPLAFQWFKNGVLLTNDARFQGVNSPFLRIATLSLNDSGNYSLTVSNALGSAISSNQLFVVSAGTPALQSVTDVGGEAFGLEIVNNVAYVAAGLNGLEIYNVFHTQRPLRTDGLLVTPVANAVRVNGNYVFVSSGVGGFKIYDTSNAGALSPIGQTNTPGTAYNFDMLGEMIYLADGESGLQIINASNPAQPFIAGTYDTLGTAYAARLSGNFAYIADGIGGLSILNITNPASITQAGSYSASTDARNLRIVGNIAYLASGTNGLLVLNVTNPAAPLLLGSHAVGQNVLDVEVFGDLAVIAKGAGGIETINITNPASIFSLGSNTSLTNATALRIRGTVLGVADGVHGLKLFELLGLTASEPVIGSPLADNAALPGDTFTFQISANGIAPLSYQWFKDGMPMFNPTNVSGATTSTLTLSNVQFDASALYSVTVRNAWNFSSSVSARLTVVPIGTPVQRFASANGDALNVQVVGQLAYVANRTGGLQITDCRNPLAPVLVGQKATAGLAQDLCVCGHLAYVAVWDAGLEIFDVSNPTNIVRLGGCDTPGLAHSIHVVGQLAYISDTERGLACIDVRDPVNPRLISSANTLDMAKSVKVSSSHAYVAASGAGLEIMNVSDPLGMKFTSQLDTPGCAEGITLVNGHAYVSDYDRGVRIINITNPVLPQLLGSYSTRSDTFQIQPNNLVAYLAAGLSRVESLNISNPAAPTLALQSLGGSRVHGLQVSGKHAFIADRDLGLVVSELLGISPVAPQIIASPASVTNFPNNRLVLSVASEGTPPLTFQWFKNGTTLVAETNLIGIDQPHLQIPITTDTNAGNYSVVVSSPYGSTTSAVATVTMNTRGTPIARGVFDTPGAGLAAVTQGHLAFIADGSTGLRIVDVNNSDAPVLVTSYAPTGGVFGVCIQTNLLYLALGTNGLEIVNVSNPAAPERLGGCDTPGTAMTVDVQGGIAFVADGTPGIQLINVTNPASPSILSSYDTSDFAYDVRVSNGHAFIADGLGGLKIANVTSPTNPIFAASYETLGTALAVKLIGTRAYVADGDQGLLVFDVANPAAPTLLGSYPAATNCVGLDVINNLVIAANNSGGYLILDTTNPASISLVSSNSPGGLILSASVVGNMAFLSSGTNGLRLVELNGVTPQPPAVIVQPTGAGASLGGTAQFRATASGSVPLKYRWFFNDQALFDGGQFSGTTTFQLTVSNVTFANSGNFTFRLWNGGGVVSSVPALLNFIGPLQMQINNAATGAVINVSSGTMIETLTLNKDVTLNGSWWNKPVLDAENRGSVLHVLPGVNVTLTGISLRNGYAALGGAILNEGSLTLDHCLIANNTATSGGGIANLGTLRLFQCVVSNNAAIASGGGLFIASNATTRITNSIIIANFANEGAGAINFGDTAVAQSLFASNKAVGTIGSGGAARSYAGILQVINSTFSGNIALPDFVTTQTGRGGALRVDNGAVQFVSSTIALNYAETRGGGCSVSSSAVGQSVNSIFAQNVSSQAPDYAGTMNSWGWNLIQNASSTVIAGTNTGNIIGVNPMLLPLHDNGGPTPTHQFATNSPAIDAGFVSTNSIDQRGIRRPFDVPWFQNGNNAGDIGAVEFVDLTLYLTASNQVASGFTLAWPTNATLQKADPMLATWADQTNASPLFVSTLMDPAGYFRLRGQLLPTILQTSNESSNGFDLLWPEFGILERAPNSAGPWDAITGFSPYHVTIVPGQTELFRLRIPEH